MCEEKTFFSQKLKDEDVMRISATLAVKIAINDSSTQHKEMYTCANINYNVKL